MSPLPPLALPPGIRSRLVEGVNGLAMHVLEAGYETPGRPALLLLHGFPELAYSWRKILPRLADAGFHAVAPDQRGYGRTTGWDERYDGDLASFRMLNLVRDSASLLEALGIRSAAAVVGHDFGAPVAAYCALTRPETFRSVVLMSAPFAGAPARAPSEDIHRELAALPRPRQHYQWYYSSPHADQDMRRCPQGVHAFLRAYYHCKSADWPGNKPYRLSSWSAAELAKLPAYYVMDLDKSMAQTVAAEMPSAAQIARCGWLPDAELAVYAAEFSRTGFQGGLQWYRCATGAEHLEELRPFAGRAIQVPAAFIAGRQDWGVYQRPGDFERMRGEAFRHMTHCELIDGAGHW
ncbi:MAG TPA: alpha/beta hydrolase, partial [Burkholderiales bacterium]|nr:alpha/beta hydrolase [Burkholderiales bacterium]